jgi:hypothetical protein
MKRLLVVAAIVVIAVPALAGSEILPINGTDGYLKFDVATGTVTPITGQTRDVGPPVWEAGSEYVNYFWGAECFTGEASVEWADLTIGQGIGGFGFSEYTNSQAVDGDLYAIFLFYEEENGHNSVGRVYTAGYLIANIPGSTHPNTEYWGYIWAVELADVFVLDGSDLDGDGLGDWGYFSFFSGQTPDSGTYHTKHGPGIAGLLMGDPNTGLHPLPPLATGAEDAFDYFVDPDYNVDEGASIDPNNLSGYVGTYWFGGPPVFSQWHFSLYARVCPNRGDSGYYCEADIDGSYDCIVGLGDLAQLLSNYGCQSDPNGPDVCTLMMGDIDPYDPWFPGDGDVDLADLALLLAQYGDDCNWP